MSDQAKKILSETLKSYQSRNLYTEKQVASMVGILQKGELSIKSQLVKYSEVSKLTPGQKVFKSRLKGLQKDISKTIWQVQKDQTLLITTATKSSFQSGVQNGISELKNAKFPRWDILNSEDEKRLAKNVLSLIDRNALDFMVRFNIQLVGNVNKELLNGIRQGITLGIIKGDSISKISEGLGSIITDSKTFRRAGKTIFKSAQQRLELITRTETLRAHNQGRLKFFDTINVKRVKWMAVGDERMCPVCGSLDGKEYKIDSMPPIPAHPACRCTTIASRAKVCESTLKKYAETRNLKLETNINNPNFQFQVSSFKSAFASNQNVDCILIPEQIEELSKLAKQEKSQVNKIIQGGKYQLLNGKTLQKLAQQRGIAVTRSKTDFIKLLSPLEPHLDLDNMTTKSLKSLMKKHHISVLRSKDDLVKLLNKWDNAHEVQIPDFDKWSIVKLRDEAKSNGISVMRTKDDLVKMLDSIEPGESHAYLKGKALQDKLKQYNIGKVRTKEELIGLLTGKIKQGQVVSKADDLVKKQFAEQIKKAKTELNDLLENLKPHEIISDPSGHGEFMQTYIKGYEILAKNNTVLLPADMNLYIGKLDSALSNWESYINSLTSGQLKNIVKKAQLGKWQWMNKDEMITMLTAKDYESQEVAMESVMLKWNKWKSKHGSKKQVKVKSGKPKVEPKAKPTSKIQTPKTNIQTGFNKVDSDWKSYESSQPFKFDGRADIDGAHTKYFYTDEKGERWLFKPVSESFRGHGDDVAYKIGRLIDNDAVEVRFVKLNVPGRGELSGSIQKWKTGLRQEFDFRNTPVTKLTKDELEQLQREHVIDWLISNHDSHGKQFIRHKNGQVYGIDKGQLYKFIGKDKLDIDYHPNRQWGEKEPIYNTIFRAFQENKIDVDLNATFHYLKQVEKITDDEFVNILKPYAEGRFGKNSANLKAFYERALHRKNHIRQDFEKYYSKLHSKRNGKKTVFKFEDDKGKSGIKLTKDAEDIVKDASNSGWQGKALAVDGDDIEDLNGLVYVEKIKGTKKTQVNLRLKVRPESEKKLLSILDDTPNTLSEIKGNPLKEDDFYSDILAGVKTLNHHVKKGDFDYNKTTIDKLKELKPNLQALKNSTDTEISQMAKEYLTAVNKVLKGVKDNKKYRGHFSQYLRKTTKATSKKKDTLPYKTQKVLYEHKQNKKGDIIIEKTVDDDLKKVMRTDCSKDGIEYRIDLGDDIQAVYKPWTDGNYYAHSGELELKITGTADSKTIERLIDKLNDLGLDGRLASPEDQELVYLYKQAYLVKEDTSPAYKKVIRSLDKANATKEQRIKALRGYWADKLGVDDISSLPDYKPYGDYALSGNGVRSGVFSESAGYREFYRFDIPEKEFEKKLKGIGLFHNFTSGRDVVKTIDQILSNNGAMISTVEKIRLGIPVGGMSPLSDMGTGGASYFFTRIQKLPSSSHSGSSGLYFKNKLLRRMDSITYEGDKYGRVTGNTVRNNRKYSVLGYKQMLNRSSDETIFKNSVSLLENIDVINVGSSSSKQELIQVFKKHNIKKLPDGRRIEDVILVSGRR